MQWETMRNESFTRREVGQIHTITEDGSDRFGHHENGTMTNGIETKHGTSQAKQTIYMLNGETSVKGGNERYPFNRRESDSSDTGSLVRTYSSASGTGRKTSGGSIGSTGGTKISSVTLPIRSASFSTARKTSSGSSESSVPASSTASAESAATRPIALPRTSSLTRQRTPADTQPGVPTVNVKYNIKLVLGEVKGSGTDGNVYIQLFGAKGNTAKIQLRQAEDVTNRFETDQEYKFVVTTSDIGKIDRIKLSHDHMEYGTGFHVKEVHIDIPSYDSHYAFPCNCWLSQDKQTEMTMKDLNALKPPAPNKGYTVSVRLGKVLDPYAKLYLQLCGEHEESTKIVLRPSGEAADAFQEGKTYKFSVEMPEIGKVERIRVGHDSRGSGKGIFLDEIEVAPDYESSIFFPCSCWLAEDIGDGRLQREIYPGTRTPRTSVSDVTHTVSVRLGEVLNPDATLYIYLVGENGETSKVFLRPEEPLQREKSYKFTLALTVDIGKIEKIRLGQDSKGYGKGLFIDSVKIVAASGDTVVFPCACWLAEDVWDSQTERELLPGQAVKRAENTAYNLTFKTGDMPYAGTDANVTLQLFGDKGRTEKIMLRQERGKTLKRFDRGRTDRFTVQTMDVGKVERIRLSHDNSGAYPEWYLESLRIEIPSRDEKYFFPCNRWLTGDEDKRVEVEVYPVEEKPVVEEFVTVSEQQVESAVPEPEPKPETQTAEYQVSFRLGEVLDPYTKLHMVIHGDNGDSGEIYLTPEGGRLEPGKLYNVNIRTTDVGSVRNIKIGQDGRSPNQGVFVEEVEVTAPRGPPVVFPCRCWLAEEEDDGQTSRVLVPGESLTSPYDIGFRLGDVLDPDTNLYIILYGDRGESEKIYLSPDGSRFVPDKLYRVGVNIKDIGDVQRVHIGHDSADPYKGVFVEEIEVTAPNSPTVIFPCRCWLAENEDDGKTARVLAPGESVTHPYDIGFRLGEVLDPNAKLFMILYGDKGESEKIYLAPSDGRKFEPGRLYTVSANIKDIGKVQRVCLGNDTRGRGRGVFVEEIEIAAPNEEPVMFPCRCWLAEDEGDGKTARVLQPGETFQPQYDIMFRLGEVVDPRAKLFMILYGDKGESGKIYLTPSDGTTFEPNKPYKVSVNMKDIGRVQRVCLGNDTRGRGRGVFVEEIEIAAPNEEPVMFPCRCWLAEDEGDGKTARVLQPGETFQPQYDIMFRLGEVLDPRAKLFMILYGDKGESGKIYLTPSDGTTFEPNKPYKVSVNMKDIGRINKVHIGNDSYGRDRGVFVEEVEVLAPGEEPVIFPCRCWLAEDEGDGKTVRVLVPGETVQPQLDTILYNMTFTTGDVPFAGTDAAVFAQLFGENGQTDRIEFGDDSAVATPKFKRGRTDKFAVETTDVGKLTKVRVGHSNLGSYPDWFLKEMLIEVPSRDETYFFQYNNWVAGEEVDLDPVDEKMRTELYTIHLKLGEVADPHAPVWIQLVGEKGVSGHIQIKPGYGPNDKFEKGRTYKVVAKVEDIGRIVGVRLGQDVYMSPRGSYEEIMDVRVGQEPSAERSRGLYVEEVEVTASRGGSEVFPCNCWTVDEEEITPEQVQQSESQPPLDTTYEVTFKTGDRPSAGTSARVFFQLFGDKGKTEVTQLSEDRSLRLFERGNSDKFKVETLDVGKIEKLQVGHDNSGRNADWYLEEITIDVPDKGEEYIFPCHRWLVGSQREVELTPAETKSLSQELDYRIMIKTGDEPDAGTDGNVFLQMFGDRGKTQTFSLREEGDKRRFERGRMDKFVIRTQDVGKLNALGISRDNKGLKPGWLLDKVTIHVAENDERYVFYCNRWLKASDSAVMLYPEQSGEDEMYTVSVEVGDVREPDVDPFCQIVGKNGETNKIKLRDGYSKTHVFTKQQTYQVSVRSPDIGEITKLRIGDDSDGHGRTVFVKKVTVVNKKGDKVEFPCNFWLGKDDSGAKVIKELIAGEAEDISYHMAILTGDKPGAGTDANVSFSLHGDKGETPRIALQDKSRTFKRFERNRADKFVVLAPDVGKLDRLIIGHDNQGSEPGWYLEEVDVDIPVRDEHYVFRCGGWIAGGDPGQRKEAVLFPVDDVKGPVDKEIHVGGESSQVDGLGQGDSDYDLEFKTANDDRAGTDSNVFFQMIGEEGKTREIHVQNREKGYFKRGQLDRFRVRAKNVGRLKVLRLGHDNSGSNPRWLLDEIVVYSRARGERYVFTAGRWIGGRSNVIDIPLDSWNSGQLVGQEPDIPDLIDYMQSGNTAKIINAAGYLQHLCYTKESVKDKVRELGGIPVIVRLLRHSHWAVKHAAICLLRNLSFSMEQDSNRLTIADCGGIEDLIEILPQTEKIEYKEAIIGVLCNLSSVESLRLHILSICLHVVVTIIIIAYSEWTLVAARGEAPVRTTPWPAVLVHATRLVRNLSSAGTRARQQLRDEKGLVDSLAWIIRIGVKSERFDNKCLEHSVCTLRNLSYRLESEVDRDRYDDTHVDVDPASVKEQQSQGCFAGCGGRKKKKVPASKRPMDGPRDLPQGVELIWQPLTVRQYFFLLKRSRNFETLEGSAGAIHNLTACSWKWAIKIRADTRKAQAIPLLVDLLAIDYDPTIRAAAIALRNLCVDSENKKVVGEKAIVNLVRRLPAGVEQQPRLVTDPTLASVLYAIHKLTNKNDKNSKHLRKTKGVQRIVRVATDDGKNYSPRVIQIANQVLATLWNHSQLQQQMKSEGWKYDATKSADLARAPLDYEATSLPRTPDERHRPEARRNRTAGDDDKWRGSSHRASGNEYHGEPIGSNDLSSESDRQRSWGDSMNQIPPPYVSDDNYSRGSRSRDEMPLEDMNSSSRPSAAGSERDETDSRNERTLKLNDSGGGGEKDDDLWV